MEQKTLKYLRVLIPGMIILLGIYPIYKYYYSDLFDLSSLDNAYITFISILFGAIYYQLDIQHIVSNPSYKYIAKNILDKLIIAYGRNISNTERNKLSRKFMRVFYNIVDNDESLKVKAENVRFNGIFWTSTADSFIINITLCIVYQFMHFVPKAKFYSNVFLFVALISLILHVISVRRHIKLSNEQLNDINVDKELKTKLKNKFDDILL